MIFTVQLADQLIEIQTDTPELRDFFKDYMVQTAPAEITISCTKEEVLGERDTLDCDFPYGYLETLAILRKISEFFPSKRRLLIHGASISYQDKGYLFTAPSGTGKSTHIKLWRKYLGEDVRIVNGDKPFISLEEPQTYIYGTPWAGKENWHRNCKVPLSGICFVQRGTVNTIRRLSPFEVLPMIMNQVFMPKDASSVGLTLELIDVLLQKVPLYLLECDISEEAVCCSFEAMTGLVYPSH